MIQFIEIVTLVEKVLVEHSLLAPCDVWLALKNEKHLHGREDYQQEVNAHLPRESTYTFDALITMIIHG